MIDIRRSFYWHWRPRIHRIGMGFIVYLPGLQIQVGHHGPPCRDCGSRENILCWDEYNPGAAICPDCCEHPDYAYERGDQRHFCVECGNDPPFDWYQSDDDAVGLSFYSCREAGEPIGTPISKLSGRPGHDGYEEFKRIAKSWGYD